MDEPKKKRLVHPALLIILVVLAIATGLNYGLPHRKKRNAKEDLQAGQQRIFSKMEKAARDEAEKNAKSPDSKPSPDATNDAKDKPGSNVDRPAGSKPAP